MLLHWVAFVAVTIIALPCWALLLSGDFMTPSSQVLKESWKYTVPVLVVLVLLLPAFAWDMVTLSNRFAGPIYRMRDVMRAAAAGEETKPLKFRDGDFWQDVADDLNILLEATRDQQQKELSPPGDESDATLVAASEAY